ncbi:MAG: polysaccharide export protein, partial [Phycisphaerales bacterium]|nr:polysaccharide export protein [Phycisphaerales bacterium]
MDFKLSRFIPISCLALASLSLLWGCETDGFVDPSRTGYFETTPSAMPILGRIDVIEQASDETEFVRPTLEDLKPSATEYTFASGDVLEISIPNLMAAGQTEQIKRIIDQTGDIQIPVINKVRAAGLTSEKLEQSIELRLKSLITTPRVSISLIEGRSFQYRVLGSVEQPGLYGLTKPDLRLLDALATSRGASVNTQRILITRTKLDNEYKAEYDRTKVDPEKGDPKKDDAKKTVGETGSSDVATPAVTNQQIDQLISDLPGPSTTAAP